MNHRHLLFFIFFFSHHLATGQPPSARALRHFSILDKQLGKIDFYLTEKDIDKRKPLLLFLDGSGATPLFRFKIDQADKHNMIMYSTIIFNYDSLATQYHIAFISKPGVRFADTFFVRSLDSNIETDPPREYTEKLSADWRAGAASAVIDYIITHQKVNTKKVAVMGYSEGAQVAPHVAVLNKKVTHLICFSGNGPNQLYDFVIQQRLRASKGELSEQETQNNIDTLLLAFKDIYAHPTSTDKFWSGHTYKRWASFCTVNPLDYMLQLNIPIYLAHGTADDNTQIINSDYVQLEFLKHHKKNLIYKTYPSCNHFFREINKDKLPIEHIDEVISEMFSWLDKQ